MELLGLVNLPGWFICIALFMLSICIYTLYKQTYFTRNGFEHKSTVFFLGDIPEMAKKGFGHIDVSLVKKHGKVFGRYIGNQPQLVVCDTEIIKTVFVKQFTNFAQRDFFPTTNMWQSGLTGAVGSHWKFLRSTLSPTFSSGKMRQMPIYIKQCLEKFHNSVDKKLETDNDINFTPILGGYALDVSCSTGFGMDVNSQSDADNLFLKRAKQALEFNATASVSFLASMLFPDFQLLHKILGPVQILQKESCDLFQSATLSVLEERKQLGSTHRDLLQLMINAHKDTPMDKEDASDKNNLTFDDFKRRGLTDDEVMMNSLIFMLGGYDTTSTTLSWLVYELMVNPHVQNKLREEIDDEIGQEDPTYETVFKMKYLDMVVKETLRVHPPVVKHRSLWTENTKGPGSGFFPDGSTFYGGILGKPLRIYAGEICTRDKDNLDDYAYMPFGLGPRNCVGMRLALLELKMTMVSIIQKYILHKSDKLTVPMPFTEMGIRKPKEPVYVHLEKRII